MIEVCEINNMVVWQFSMTSQTATQRDHIKRVVTNYRLLFKDTLYVKPNIICYMSRNKSDGLVVNYRLL